MDTVPVRLPKGLVDRARAEAASRGFESVEAYIAWLIDEDAAFDAELEQLLLERLNDPGPSIEMTRADFERMREKVRALAKARRAGAE